MGRREGSKARRGGTLAKTAALSKNLARAVRPAERIKAVYGEGEKAASSGQISDGQAFDRLIHERIRLGIVSALAVNDSLTFNELKSLLKTTDGNLSVHARKLEEADYIHCAKSFDGRLPKTEFRLSTAGRRAFEKYLDHMEALIRATRER
jgi:DNA-binding MarR family transcriptional regulator